MLPLPERVLAFGNMKYNKALAELEEWLIKRHNPYVIDVTKYFIADQNFEPDVTPVHYEENYRKSAWALMKHILLERPERRYFDELPKSVTADLLNRKVSDTAFGGIYRDYKKPFNS